MYVTATLPYLFMIILLIRNCMLPGSGSGIKYYLTPNVTKLGEMQVRFQHSDRRKYCAENPYLNLSIYYFSFVSTTSWRSDERDLAIVLDKNH